MENLEGWRLFFLFGPALFLFGDWEACPSEGEGRLGGAVGERCAHARARVCECARARALLLLGSLGRTGVLGDDRGNHNPLSVAPDTPDCALTLPTQPAAFSREAVVHSLFVFTAGPGTKVKTK